MLRNKLFLECIQFLSQLSTLSEDKSELTMRCPYDQHLYADEDFIVGCHPDDPDIVVASRRRLQKL